MARDLTNGKKVIHPWYVESGPTVCVTGAGAGVDSVWEQKKLEARKMPENGAESPASSARFVGRQMLDKEIWLKTLRLYFLSEHHTQPQ
jgi:hypothetical protein